VEKGMKEPDIEGVATHGGPKSCDGACEDGGEALTGVRVGWASEPRNQGSGVPTPVPRPEGNIVGSARRELPADPTRSKDLCMRGSSMRENREVHACPSW
jgi:RNA-directed DNA polymerase